jgi:glycine dehydrogenase
MTGLDVANASLLDEGTAAAEAMSLCFRHNKRKKIYLSQNLHPQTISVVETRLRAFDIEVVIGPIEQIDYSTHDYSGVLLQYPDTYGDVKCFENSAIEARKNGVSGDKFPTQVSPL